LENLQHFLLDSLISRLIALCTRTIELTKRKRKRELGFSKLIGDSNFAILLAKYTKATGRVEQAATQRDRGKEGRW